MTLVIVSMISMLVGGWAVQWAVWIGSRRERRLGATRRLGLLGTGEDMHAGEFGTYRVYNSANNSDEILYVDWERGEMLRVCEDPRR